MRKTKEVLRLRVVTQRQRDRCGKGNKCDELHAQQHDRVQRLSPNARYATKSRYEHPPITTRYITRTTVSILGRRTTSGSAWGIRSKVNAIPV